MQKMEYIEGFEGFYEATCKITIFLLVGNNKCKMFIEKGEKYRLFIYETGSAELGVPVKQWFAITPPQTYEQKLSYGFADKRSVIDAHSFGKKSY